MEGRRYSEGLHCVGVKKRTFRYEENQTLGNYYAPEFLMYDKLSGIFGTAMTVEDAEFREVYHVPNQVSST